MQAATTKAAMPAFRYLKKMAVAAPNAHAECVEGKEELVGLLTSNANA